MTLQQIIQRLATEREIGSRFPVRVIFVDSIKQYNELLQSLSQVCDKTLELASFCSGPDTFPNFSKMLKEIENKYKGKQILLLSVSEYLRLAIRYELRTDRAQIPALWQRQQNASSKTRIIIPMLYCQELWDRVMPEMDERQLDYAWTLESVPQEMVAVRLEVYSQDFINVLPNDKAVQGMREWLFNWNDHLGSVDGKHKVITSLWKHAENITSAIETHVISNVFEYITSALKDGNILKKEWGTDEEWLSLIPSIISGVSISKVIENILNVRTFDPLALLAQWSMMTGPQRWLVWLWYRINSRDDYYSYAIKQNSSYLDVEKMLSYSIFDVVSKRPEWIEQRTKAMSALKIAETGAEYFKRVDSLPLMETRLALLTCATHSEKTHVIKTISEWLRKDADINAVSASVTDKFPLLSQYMTTSSDAYSSELGDYYSWYRKHKVMNILPNNSVDKVQTVSLDSFSSRYSVLKQIENLDSTVLWVDAMGAEWLPLLMRCIIKYCTIGTVITQKVVQSILPTETCYNEQWKNMDIEYTKLDKLDNLAHKGMPDDKDYFSCIAHQLNEIENVAKTAATLLEEFNYVAITADHGTSRLAALAFHNLPGISAPSGAKVKSHGRYCEIDRPFKLGDNIPGTLSVRNNDCNFIVFGTHEHYVQSGNAAGKNDADHAHVGEVHGGATPEEVLVPIIILKRKTPLQKLEASLLTPTVYRDKGAATVEIEFNKPVASLSAIASGINGVCSPSKGGTLWSLLFEEIETQSYVLQLEADGKILDEQQSFSVKAKGIIRNDDMFGGL